jgi:capsular polysaccharide transport system permease protein
MVETPRSIRRSGWIAEHTRLLRIQLRVIGALTLREAMTHYGRESLGFFWLVAEPAILTIGVMIMWTITGNTHGKSVGVIPFALSGYSLLTIHRHVVSHSVHMYRRNASLLFHRHIHLLDIVIARHLLTMVGGVLAFYLTWLPFYLLDYTDSFHDPLLMSAGFVLMTWYAAGIGLIIAALTEMYEPAERFVQPVMYVTLPFTGAFYMVEWLPEKARYWILLSPQVHINEMFRDGMYGHLSETYWNVPYMLIWCVALTAFGLALLRPARLAVRFD